MKLDFFHDQTLDAMEAYMGRLSQRQQVVASNLANIETPGYKSKDISFYATMQELLPENSTELQQSDPEHIQTQISPSPQAQVFEEQGNPARADGNNVDLDKEMLKLSETSFGYSMITQLMREKFHMLASSINEGKS
jgi:flagellar basal-body rod protein FlgB